MEAGLVISKDGTALQLKSSGTFVSVTESTLEKYLLQFGIIHLPQMVYQSMYDAAPRNLQDMEPAKKRGQAILLGFLQDHYPDYILGNFVDLTTIEAKAVHPKLTWGMWIQLVPKNMKELPPPFEMNDLKQLCYGKRIGYSNE